MGVVDPLSRARHFPDELQEHGENRLFLGQEPDEGSKLTNVLERIASREPEAICARWSSRNRKVYADDLGGKDEVSRGFDDLSRFPVESPAFVGCFDQYVRVDQKRLTAPRSRR